jgi:hypothetical protein
MTGQGPLFSELHQGADPYSLDETTSSQTMPYVNRNTAGQIDSIHRTPTAEAAEFLAENDPELLQFLGHRQFLSLDADFVRVIEDVIDTLIVKNLINITDLPLQAQAKLLARKSFRDRASRHSLRVLQENEA